LPDDKPPEGFLRIDFDRGRPDPTFNSHIGNLYAKRGAKGTRRIRPGLSRAPAHVQPGGRLRAGVTPPDMAA
jgi:hypothetical protein